MPAANRALGRDVHIYAASDPTGPVLGGLVLTNGVTNVNLYSMVEVFLLFDSNYVLRHEDVMDDSKDVPKDEQALQPGDYYILTDGSIKLTDEPWLVRTISVASGTRTTSFRDAVRERDGRCIITGESAANARGDWTGFQAAHIFPLAYEEHWNKHNYGRWITIPPATESAGSINSVQNGMLLDNTIHASAGSINSVQNGMLLDNTIHALFDSYDVSINPNDNYKIVCFNTDRKGIAGRHLDQRFLEDPSRPVDQLLRWHFRQAVLANMRGAGEPIFECDFPPGSDMIGEILSGPRAGERLEFEFFSRLAGVTRSAT